MRDDDTGIKTIPVARLARLLGELPPTSVAMVNAVGNLAIYESHADALVRGRLFAWIDFNCEVLELVD